MKQHIKILVFLAFFIAFCSSSCKKEEQHYDIRDKFVGTYTGRATTDDFFYPHKIYPNDPEATLKIIKHPTIDNALQVIEAYVNYPQYGVSYYYFSGIDDYDVIFYVSQNGLLYINGTGYYDFNKNCQFIEPDSLFTTVPFADNGGGHTNYFFRMKKD